MVIYRFRTRAGVAEVRWHRSRWLACFNGESLGSYRMATQAVADLTNGQTFRPACGIDIASLRIPPDLEKWSRVQ